MNSALRAGLSGSAACLSICLPNGVLILPDRAVSTILNGLMKSGIKQSNLVVALTGATGAVAAKILVEKSPWPVTLVASRWGRTVYEKECGAFSALADRVDTVYEDEDLSAPISSGSVATVGMVILPCSCNTLGEIASGVCPTLITRAAHCHMKERRPLILCLREAPLSLIDLKNSVSITEAGGILMPLSPPYYMLCDKPPESVSLQLLLEVYIDRVLALLGRQGHRTWEDVR